VLRQAQAAFYGHHRSEKISLVHALFTDLVEPETIADPRAPALVVWGRADVVFPLEIGQRLAAGLVYAELAIIEEAGHVPTIEQPERFNDIMLSFLDRAACART
jgi:pimeloyl-ACP methyl ester carboxylesterase